MSATTIQSETLTLFIKPHSSIYFYSKIKGMYTYTILVLIYLYTSYAINLQMNEICLIACNVRSLVSKVKHMVEVDPALKIHIIVVFVKDQYGYKISYWKAWYAK